MYAMTFIYETDTLSKASFNSFHENAEKEINEILCGKYGFVRQQGSLYFGNEKTNAVLCVSAVQELAIKLPWFATAIRDIKMLRIEEVSDLRPAMNWVLDACKSK